MNLQSIFSRRFTLLFFLLHLLIQNSFSQTLAGADVTDSQTWASIGVSYKLNKKLNFKLEQQLRLKENSQITDEHFTELNVDYQLSKKIGFGFGSRYIFENDTEGANQNDEKYFRYNIDGFYKYKFDRFSFKHRLRYQNKNRLGQDDNPIINARFKTSIAYNIRKWKLDPKISGEIFKRFQEGEETRYNKYRFTIETEYKIKKIGSFSIFYRVDQEMNIINAETIKILGLKLSFKIK